MSTTSRPLYFYLFPEGKDIKIEQMTDTEAMNMLKKDRKFIDIACKTREEAEAKRSHYLSMQKRQRN